MLTFTVYERCNTSRRISFLMNSFWHFFPNCTTVNTIVKVTAAKIVRFSCISISVLFGPPLAVCVITTFSDWDFPMFLLFIYLKFLAINCWNSISYYAILEGSPWDGVGSEWSIGVAVAAESYPVPDRPYWADDWEGSVAILSGTRTPLAVGERGSGCVGCLRGVYPCRGLFFSESDPDRIWDISLWDLCTVVIFK